MVQYSPVDIRIHHQSAADHQQIMHIRIVKLRRGSGKDRQGMAPKAKGLKLKPLPRAYTKVGRHPPQPGSLISHKWPDSGQTVAR